MTLSARDKSVVLAAFSIGLIVILGTALYVVLDGFARDPNSGPIRNEVCRQEAHELGYRFLDYVHPFGECWAQRPDGSIVDLFAEAEP